jgi:general stress protein 26
VQRLGELIGDFPIAMLTTSAQDHSLHSRPMINVNKSFQGELWFFTHFDDPKVEEVRGNPQVNVAFAAPDEDRYVSVSGSGSTMQDTKRCELLWTDECKTWFPKGPGDPELALIKIEVERAEYWDAKSNAMVAVKGFFKSLAGADKPKRVKHDKLDWQESKESPPA